MRQKQKAFTLIELLVVIAIIGVLAAVILSGLNTARMKTRDTARLQTVREVQKALELYLTQHGSYPPMTTPSAISSLAPYLTPTFIRSIDYDLTDVSGATYYRPASSPDSYLIYVSYERQTQVSPSAYGCRTGVGPVVSSGLYATAPQC